MPNEFSSEGNEPPKSNAPLPRDGGDSTPLQRSIEDDLHDRFIEDTMNEIQRKYVERKKDNTNVGGYDGYEKTDIFEQWRRIQRDTLPKD